MPCGTGWHETRFVFDVNKIECLCAQCGGKYWLPKSKSDKYLTCGGICAKQLRAQKKEALARICITCGTKFYPRQTQIKNGVGKYCSRQCNKAGVAAITSKESLDKSRASYMKSLSLGLIVHPSGAMHPKWRGGKAASLERTKSYRAAYLIKYRKNNPHKVREFVQSRSRRKFGKLPKGTVLKIKELQQNKCAICKINLSKGFHVDHVYPLAKEGLHCKLNIQLLCPRCNVRKSAKDPIVFMQSLGFLL